MDIKDICFFYYCFALSINNANSYVQIPAFSDVHDS